MSTTLKIIVLCALVLPVIGAMLARSQSSHLSGMGKAVESLGKMAGAIVGLVVVLVLVLILYLSWQFSS